MAFSREDDFYIALYCAWSDPIEDDHYIHFITEQMKSLELYSTGIQLADENLLNRTARFMSEENMRKLDKIRLKWGRDEVFLKWWSRP